MSVKSIIKDVAIKGITWLGWNEGAEGFQHLNRSQSGIDRLNYATQIGNPLYTPLVMAACKWMERNVHTAPLYFTKRNDEGILESISLNHQALKLIKRPNDYYSGKTMMKSLGVSWMLSGNAYIIKLRDQDRIVRELWYEPHFTIRPRWPGDNVLSSNQTPRPATTRPGSEFISFYEVYRGYQFGQQQWIKVAVEDVIHFKDGMDPHNPRLGINGLAALMAEIYTDTQRAHFSATVLSNLGMIPFVVSPREGNRTINEKQAEKLKTDLEIRAKSDRGKPIVAGAAIRVDELGIRPEEMSLSEMADIPEERVAAVIGPNAYVLGFVDAKFSNLVEARRDAYECLPANARIWTERGPRELITVQVGEKVWSLSKDGKMALNNVLAVGFAGTKLLLEVTTSNKKLRGSGNHPVLTCNGQKVNWKRMDQLVLGDDVIQIKSVPDLGVNSLPGGEAATPDLMQFFGAWIGDGLYLGKNKDAGVFICMPEGDRVRKDYYDLMQRLKFEGEARGHSRRVNIDIVAQWAELVSNGVSFEAIAKLQIRPALNIQKEMRLIKSAVTTFTKHAEGHSEQVVARVVLKPTGISIHSKKVADFMKSAGFASGFASKRIPSWVYTLTRELRLAFLAGLVDSDGSITRLKTGSYFKGRKRIPYNGCRLAFRFANQALTNDVKDLMLSLGMECGNISKVDVDRIWPTGHISRGTAWAFMSSGQKLHEIPFADLHYRRLLKKFGQPKQKSKPNPAPGLSQEFGAYKVKKIRLLDSEPTFDIQVEHTKNFIADGVVVHNSYLIPTCDYFAEELTTGVLEELTTEENTALEYDFFDVPAMIDYKGKLFEIWGKAFRDGIATRHAALLGTSQSAKKKDKVFIEALGAFPTSLGTSTDKFGSGPPSQQGQGALNSALPPRDQQVNENERTSAKQDKGPNLGGKK